jgi:hypothetical protein
MMLRVQIDPDGEAHVEGEHEETLIGRRSRGPPPQERQG